MAISTNLLLKNLSGRIGKQLVIKQYGNKTVITKYPDFSSRKLSTKQKAVNESMEKATERALEIIASDTLRNEAQVRLNVTRNRLYPALISEYFRSLRNEG
jgi:hypothetical protein